VTLAPRADDAEAWERATEAAWREFVARWRRRRAPAALRERIVAALEALEAREAPREGDESHG